MEEALVKPLLFHDEAIAELDAAIAWYNDQHRGLGLALHVEVQAVLDRIPENPQTGSLHGSRGYRFLQTKRFPYVVYWIERDAAIWIAAVANAHRRPGYWKHREPGE